MGHHPVHGPRRRVRCLPIGRSDLAESTPAGPRSHRFGEIIPQSICVRYGLAIGAASAPFVLALMCPSPSSRLCSVTDAQAGLDIEYPIAYPIAMLLDWTLGHDEGTTYRKAELKTFVGLHRRASRRSPSGTILRWFELNVGFHDAQISAPTA